MAHPMQVIQRHVAERFGMTVAELLAKTHVRAVAQPRQVSMWLARRLLPGASLTAIGRAHERDHTTVAWAVRRVKALYAGDPEWRAEIDELLATLRPLLPDPAERRRRIRAAVRLDPLWRFERLARRVGFHTARRLFAQRGYSVSGSLYGKVQGTPTLRVELNPRAAGDYLVECERYDRYERKAPVHAA